jgi:hypothetical protein
VLAEYPITINAAERGWHTAAAAASTYRYVNVSIHWYVVGILDVLIVIVDVSISAQHVQRHGTVNDTVQYVHIDMLLSTYWSYWAQHFGPRHEVQRNGSASTTVEALV